jgi:hypothetical protein
MGSCNSCEPVMENTSQDWTRFTTDKPTAIGQVSPMSPQFSNWQASYKDLASSLIKQQEVPDLGTAGAGLSGLAQALTKADSFRDLTGLAGNQQNAQKTLEANNQMATKMAEAASGLMKQKANIENSEEITKAIKKDVKDGSLPAEKGEALLEAHHQQKIDAGVGAQRKDEAKEVAKDRAENNAGIVGAGVAAAKDGDKAVTVSHVDTKGNQRKLEVKPAARPASFAKTLSVQVKDFMGEPFGQPLTVTVVSADSDKKSQEFDMRGGYGKFTLAFNTDSPTFMVKVCTYDMLEQSVFFPIHFESSTEDLTMQPAQKQMNLKITQDKTKKTISVKATSNLVDEMSAELATELSASGTSSSKSAIYDLTATIAGKISTKYATKTSSGQGAEDVSTFDVVWPLQNWTPVISTPQVLK